MLFFGFHMLLGRAPEKNVFAMLYPFASADGHCPAHALNYAVHLFCNIRQRDVNATILMNLSTYFLCCWLFSRNTSQRLRQKLPLLDCRPPHRICQTPHEAASQHESAGCLRLFRIHFPQPFHAHIRHEGGMFALEVAWTATKTCGAYCLRTNIS